MAGLCAAYELRRQGHQVTLLEAQKRPGGRVRTLRENFAPGLYVEAGAESIPSAHELIRHYAAEEKLRTEFAQAGKAIQFEAFRQYLTTEEEPAAYAEVAAALEMSESAVKVAVHRARRRFGVLLREQIAQTVAGPAEAADWERAVEDEVRYLFRLLAS